MYIPTKMWSSFVAKSLCFVVISISVFVQSVMKALKENVNGIR